MRIIRNEAFLKKRVQYTQRGTLIGMGLLVVSFFLSTKPVYFMLSWLLLIAGYVVAMSAVRVGNRYVRLPRPDQALDKVLKGLDNKYILYHYFYPSEHLLLTPSGLISILAREQRGQISARGNRWRQRPFTQKLRFLLGDAGLGNPARELATQMSQTANKLGELPGGDSELPLDGMVLFYSGKTTLDVQDAEYPVLLPDALKAAVRAQAEAHPALPRDVHKALAARLRGEEAAIEEADPEEPAEEEASEGAAQAAPSRKSRKKKGRPAPARDSTTSSNK